MNETVKLEVIGPGRDAVSWTVAGPGAGDLQIVVGNDGIENIWETPRKTVWTHGAYQESATVNGETVGLMDTVFVFELVADDKQSAQRIYSQFRKAWSFNPAKPTLLRATTESGVRDLGLVLLETPVFTFITDNYFKIAVQARPPWPFWVEEDVFDVWKAEASNRVVPASGAPYYTGPVVVDNPTNRPNYLKWVIYAPNGGTAAVPDFSWETDPDEDDYEFHDRMINIPVLAAGEELTIDSYPDNLTWSSNINPMFIGRSAGIEFDFPVPPDTDATEIPVKASTAGTVIQVRSWRHWTTLMGGE